MKTYVSPQEQKRDSNVSRMTTRVDKSVHDVVARAAKIGGLSISKYMEQAILKQALADIYFEDIALLSLKSKYFNFFNSINCFDIYFMLHSINFK